jgi:putative toxin-antitoxin system antitoxin component (TIGR02293 family)
MTVSASSTALPAAALGGSHALGLKAEKASDLVRAVRRGFPFRTLEDLAGATGLSAAELAALLALPARTLARRKVARRLSAEESERLLRLAAVFEQAQALFEGDAAQALAWLRAPKKALDGETPLHYASTEVGAREVERLIGRIEHGVFA